MTTEEMQAFFNEYGSEVIAGSQAFGMARVITVDDLYHAFVARLEYELEQRHD